MITKMLSDLKEDDLRALLSRDVGITDVLNSVNEIVMEVGEKGDEALFKFTEKFEGARLDELRVGQEEIDAAYDLVEDRLKEALADAADNIFHFHRQQKDRDLWLTEVAPGIEPEKHIIPFMDFRPAVSSDLKVMDRRIFVDSLMGLREEMESRTS